jgi:hypothetical protein
MNRAVDGASGGPVDQVSGEHVARRQHGGEPYGAAPILVD